jgi:hypothetical protein
MDELMYVWISKPYDISKAKNALIKTVLRRYGSQHLHSCLFVSVWNVNIVTVGELLS